MTARLWVIGPNWRMATSLALSGPQRALNDSRGSRPPIAARTLLSKQATLSRSGVGGKARQKPHIFGTSHRRRCKLAINYGLQHMPDGISHTLARAGSRHRLGASWFVTRSFAGSLRRAQDVARAARKEHIAA